MAEVRKTIYLSTNLNYFLYMAETLYIIGNGFDLHHGLKTSYRDFRESFAKKKYVLWKYLYDIYGEAIYDDLWWSTFEEMLARIDYNHLIQTYNGIAMGAYKVQNLLKGTLPPLFGAWIKQMDINVNPDTSLNIDSNALFFTFNYTHLLEKAYQIKEQNVWHIHGSIYDIDNIVVGHDSDERMLWKRYEEYKKICKNVNSNFAEEINRMVDKGAKRVKYRIDEHKDEFYSLYQNIKQIIVMGFSLNEIDMPYIKAIIDANDDVSNLKWTIYYHNDGEDKEMNDKLINLGINRGNINKPIKW